MMSIDKYCSDGVEKPPIVIFIDGLPMFSRHLGNLQFFFVGGLKQIKSKFFTAHPTISAISYFKCMYHHVSVMSVFELIGWSLMKRVL